MTTDDARALKEQGQQASLFGLSEQTWVDFQRILRIASIGERVCVNSIREYLDLAGIPDKSRGALFARAVRAGILEPVVTAEGHEVRIKSLGVSAHAATVRLYRRAA